MKKTTHFTALTILFWLMAQPLWAANYIYNGLDLGNWGEPTNWLPIGVPSLGDDANISGRGVTLSSGGATIRNLNLTNGGSVNGVSPLTVTGNAVITGAISLKAAVSIEGNLTLNGADIGSQAALSITDITVSGVFTTTGANFYKKRLILNGGGNWTSGAIGLQNGSILEIPVGKTFTSNTTLNNQRITTSDVGTLDVKGTFKNESGPVTFEVPVNNSGTVNVTGGVIYMRAGSTSTGNFNSEVTNGIQFAGNDIEPHTLQSGASFSGNGSILIAAPINATGATFNPTVANLNVQSIFNLAGTFNHIGNLTITTGSFAPIGSATIGGNLTLNGASLGTSTAPTATDFIVAGLTTFTVPSGFDNQILRKKLIMNGGGSWSSSGRIIVRDGSTLEIPINQTFTFNQGTTNFEDFGTLGNAVEVKGTLRKLGTGTVSMSSNTPTALISLNNTGTMLIDAGNFDVNSPYSGNGSISTATGATLSIGNAAGLNYPNATFTNNGTVSGNALIFNGVVQQTIAGTGSDGRLGRIERLQINNANDVSITGAQVISTNLNFATGKIQLTNTNLALGGNLTVTNVSTTKYIQINGTASVGRTVLTSSVHFPIGTSTSYTPISIRQVSGSAGYQVRVRNGIDPAHPLPATTAAVTKEWDISPIPSSFNPANLAIDATINIQWNMPTDEGAGFVSSLAKLWHYNGTIWESLALPTGTTTIACATGICNLTKTGVTTFSPFTVGMSTAALPLELLDFKAISHKSTIDLEWQTASEKDVSHFDIEQSTDGKTFSKIGETKAKGGASDYQFTTTQPLSNRAYFRLKMVDLNGDFTYSKIVSLAFGKDLSVTAYPNPVSNELTINAFAESKYLDIQVLDVLGRSIYQKKVQNTEGSNLLIVNTLEWNSGIYFLKVADGKTVFLQKIMKE